MTRYKDFRRAMDAFSNAVQSRKQIRKELIKDAMEFMVEFVRAYPEWKTSTTRLTGILVRVIGSEYGLNEDEIVMMGILVGLNSKGVR